MPFPARNRLALAFTLGLHALAALFWLQAPRPRPADAPEVVSVLLDVPMPASRPAAMPASSTRAAPMPVRRAPPAVRPPRAATASDVTPPPATPADPAQALDAVSPSASSEPADLPAAETATAAPSGAGMALDLSKRQAGRIDRELRKGKSGVPAEADTPWARFRRGLEAAHVEPSLGVTIDSYTAPDGVVIYRERVGSRTFCRRSGSVGPGIAGMRGINDAGSVPCPSGVEWKRD